MCGRYYIEPSKKYDALLEVALTNHPNTSPTKTYGDIYPSEKALCLGRRNNDILPGILKWGYPLNNTKDIINTRIESVLTKPIYINNFLYHRLVVVASGFYEWDHNKNKYQVTSNNDLLYLAGIYEPKTKGFSILTYPSYGDLSKIHHRSPIILNEDNLNHYLFGNLEINDLLNIKPPQHLKSSL